MSSRQSLVCIAGGDGSGKTTQVARVAAAFEAHGQTVAPVTIWDAFLDPAVATKLPFRPADVYGYLKVLNPLSRAHFLFHAIHLAFDLATKRDADVILLNAYWFKYFATEVAHGGDPEALRGLAAGFPTPDHVFYLRISPSDALARKGRRSDYESGYGDEQQFLLFQQRSHAVLAGLAAELGWADLDGTQTTSAITEQILDRLRDNR